MSPLAWRKSLGLSQAAVAAALNLGGRNPARTWQRWERGERVPSLDIIVQIETRSEGRVTLRDWHALQALLPAGADE